MIGTGPSLVNSCRVPSRAARVLKTVLSLLRRLERERAGVLLEPAQHATATFDRLGGQPTSHHLRLPAVDHRVEHAIFGSKKTDLGVSKNPRNEARNSLHGTPSIRGNLHRMQETFGNLRRCSRMQPRRVVARRWQCAG